MKGTTLIETIIYLALLSILMTGIIPSIYNLIGSKEKNSLMMYESDASILLKKYHE